MLKNLNKGLALFMAIAVMALNLGLINDVSADELEGTDQILGMPLPVKNISSLIKDVPSNEPQPAEPELTVTPPGGGNTPAQETINHGAWCSALLGVATTDSLRNNKVIDINDDGYVNLLDVGMTVQLYADNNNAACQARFQSASTPTVYNFTDADYTNIDWCGGLVQGIKDYFAGSTYNPIFDLNENSEGAFVPDGFINLSDVGWAVAHNNQAHCYEHYNFPAEALTPPVETVTINHKPWCSALLGVMKGYASSTLSDNKVIDINGDEVVNLLDIGLGVQLYHNNDDAACQARFQSASTPTVYNFTAADYTNIDWCGGLTQGVKDYFAGSTYNPIFDLNEDSAGVITPDGFINLIDTGLAVQHNTLENNQAHCYLHYGLPSMTPPVTEPVIPTVVPPTPELNNGGGNHSGNNLLNYVPNPVLMPTPEVLGEKVVECKNKANTTLTQFKEGTLVRGCGPEIYIIKDGKKIHIINLDTLRSKYFGKKILNIGDLINDIKDSSVKVVSAKK